MGTIDSSCAGCADGIFSALKGGRRSLGGAKAALNQAGVVVERSRVGSWTSPTPRRIGDPCRVSSDIVWNQVESIDGVNVAIKADPDGNQRLSAETGASPHFLMEQLLASPGRLPPPLPAEERERILRELQPTATIEMLDQVPRELLEASSREGQELRRRLLNNATIVFFTAGYPGKRFIFERARDLGVKSVIIEHPDSWARELVDEGVIAKFIPIDMSQDANEVFDQAMSAIRALGDDALTLRADGIVTFCELSVSVVARLSEALGLPGPPPLAVDKARDKHRTRDEMRLAGLPSPKNALLRSAADLASAAHAVGFPAVLKPISGAASLGVKKVSNEGELRQSYAEVLSELQSLVVSSGALVKADGSGTGVDANKVMDCTILLEQYLDGKEVDVDVVMSDGDWQYAAVTDNGPTLEPYFNETWAVCPSLLNKSQQQELKELSVNTVKCLGFRDGVFHVECKLTSHGPHLIEVNARMGGGQVHETNLRVWGVDLVEETLFAAAGIPSRPFIPSKEPPGGAVAYCDINATRSGTLKSLEFLKPLAGKEGVVWAKPYIQPGTQVVGPQDGLPTWLAEIVVQRATARQALDYLFELQNSVDPPIV